MRNPIQNAPLLRMLVQCECLYSADAYTARTLMPRGRRRRAVADVARMPIRTVKSFVFSQAADTLDRGDTLPKWTRLSRGHACEGTRLAEGHARPGEAVYLQRTRVINRAVGSREPVVQQLGKETHPEKGG